MSRSGNRIAEQWIGFSRRKSIQGEERKGDAEDCLAFHGSVLRVQWVGMEQILRFRFDMRTSLN
ncbi:hypothetical protein EMIT0P2_10207 [Pseudomonas sp. IT-P2]